MCPVPGCKLSVGSKGTVYFFTTRVAGSLVFKINLSATPGARAWIGDSASFLSL